ncbi:Flp family type IVb pilin [Kordiimonas sp. SCSIO 12603]|nr:Flp family type IVb pilin [Kordiimonas sp. SCSIO 12603]
MKWHNAQARFFRSLRKMIQDTSGATAIEYGLIIGLIAIALIGVLTTFTDSMDTMLGEVSTVAEENATNTEESPS